jgi:acyl-CoA dehydrogenase
VSLEAVVSNESRERAWIVRIAVSLYVFTAASSAGTRVSDPHPVKLAELSVNAVDEQSRNKRMKTLLQNSICERIGHLRNERRSGISVFHKSLPQDLWVVIPLRFILVVMPLRTMEFDEPAAANELKEELFAFIKREIEPLEEDHDQFLGPDAERHIFDENFEQVPEYLNLKETIRRRAAEAGFWGMNMPESVGGRGIDTLTDAIVSEFLENRPPGFHTYAIQGAGGGPTPILLACDDDQRERYLDPLMAGEKTTCFALTEPDHGSDPNFLETSAERDGDEWIINGEKSWISNGPYADFAMVFARTSGDPGEVGGISCFLVDADTAGFEVGDIHRPMGHAWVAPSKLTFDDCRVTDEHLLGEEGTGFYQAMDWIGNARLNVAAGCVGSAQFLVDKALDYAERRETFGKPLIDRQGISFPLAEVATDIERTRQLYRFAAWKVDNERDARKEIAMAKLSAANLENRAADVAMQVHGGSGYSRREPIEERYRTSRGKRLTEGTDEMQKQTIVRELRD